MFFFSSKSNYLLDLESHFFVCSGLYILKMLYFPSLYLWNICIFLLLIKAEKYLDYYFQPTKSNKTTYKYFFKIYLCIDLKESEEAGLEYFNVPSTVHSPNSCNSWGWTRRESGILLRVFCFLGKGSSTSVIRCCPRCTGGELGQKWNRQESNRCSHMGFQHNRCWLKSLHHNASSPT